MKLLMTADAVGGVWQYSVDLLRGLSQAGAEIVLATMGPRPSAVQREEVAVIARVRLIESEYALEWMQNPWRDVDAATGWLQGVASDFGPDLIHLNGYSHAAIPWQKPVVAVAHSCVFSWWRSVHGDHPGAEWEEYKRRVATGLAAATAVVAPSRFMADAVEKEYSVPAEKVQVIHNFSRAPRSRTGRKQPYCLAAGRIWDPAKNLGLLNAVADKIDWPIRIAGDRNGPEQGATVSAGLEPLGRLSHSSLMQQMHKAAIFTHPALYEPFGLAVLEAAGANCCLVLSNIPSLRELWQGAAVFADPHDPDEWVFELNRLICNRLVRENLAGRAFQRSSCFTPARSVRAYVDLYAQIIQQCKTKAAGVAA
jgi:glycogen(starch) synthase